MAGSLESEHMAVAEPQNTLFDNNTSKWASAANYSVMDVPVNFKIGKYCTYHDVLSSSEVVYLNFRYKGDKAQFLFHVGFEEIYKFDGEIEDWIADYLFIKVRDMIFEKANLTDAQQHAMEALIRNKIRNAIDNFSPNTNKYSKVSIVAGGTTIDEGGAYLKSHAKFELEDFGFATSTDDEATQLANAAKSLPGMDYVSECPEPKCPADHTLYALVQHLNDVHMWSREKIADWLDELHDSGAVNLEFQPWDETGMAEEEADVGSLSEGWQQVGYITEEEVDYFKNIDGQSLPDAVIYNDSIGENNVKD